MTRLNWNGHELRSLADLRANVDGEKLTATFLDGTLEQWLTERRYEREAGAIEDLPHQLSPEVERQLRSVLGIDAPTARTPEEQADYERRCDAIRCCTTDPSMLSHAMDTAVDQTDLAELLDAGHGTIYLCTGPFSIPIGTPRHYVAIGSPTLESPYTQEQYRRAGVMMEGFCLPEAVSKEQTAQAARAAKAHGYDDFDESHDRLSSLFHFAVKSQEHFDSLRLNVDPYDVASEFYKSKSAAKKAAESVINRAYDQANAFFTPGSSTCISRKMAKQYAETLQSGAEELLEQLAPACTTPLMAKKLSWLKEQVDHGEKNLREQFDEELRDSADYYQMYKRSYFLERFSIEDHDFNLDLFDHDLFNGIARLINDQTEYSVTDLPETVQEMNEDIRTRADTFFAAAHRAYRDYCAEMEKAVGEIGKHLSDGDLTKLGIEWESQSA